MRWTGQAGLGWGRGEELQCRLPWPTTRTGSGVVVKGSGLLTSLTSRASSLLFSPSIQQTPSTNFHGSSRVSG